MIKQYITQAIAQLRQQPIISAVSVIGTALAIFLIMLVVMMQQVKTAPFAPESNRDRFLHAHYLTLENKNWGENSSNGPMSTQTGKELYASLKTPEAVTIYGCDAITTPVSLPKQPATSFDLRQTDDVFWKVFDFQFIEGKPYDKATFEASIPVAILSETVARTVFGTTKGIIGKEFLLSKAKLLVITRGGDGFEICDNNIDKKSYFDLAEDILHLFLPDFRAARISLAVSVAFRFACSR